VLLTGDKELVIERVAPGSPASKGGLKRGDRILDMDGHPVHDIYDLKLELFFKQRGSTSDIAVLRKDRDGNVRKRIITTGPLVPFKWTGTSMHFHSK
jgi:S1-C subfamily serine protease